MAEYISDGPEMTENIAAEFSKTLSGGEIIAFRGGLGMGKTCFTRGLARGLGYTGTVNSPTFALINEYTGGRLEVYHFDMYRVSTWEDLYSSGYYDYIELGGVTVLEWSENVAAALEGKVITVTISSLGDDKRRIIIEKEEEL